MLKLTLKEYIEGYQYYETNIRDENVADFNDYITHRYEEEVEPLTMNDIKDLILHNTDNPRYFETHTFDYGGKYPFVEYLNSMVYEWFQSDAYDNPIGDISYSDTIETEVYVDEC